MNITRDVRRFAGDAILLSAAAQAGLDPTSVQMLSKHWKGVTVTDALSPAGSADADRSFVLAGARHDKIGSTLQYIESFSTTVTTVSRTLEHAKSEISLQMSELSSLPRNVKRSASMSIFVAFFMAAEPVHIATCYSWTSTSWTRMMGRTVYFTGALAFQALTFRFDGSALQEDSDPRCSQKTVHDKIRIGALYAIISFLMSSLPAIALEAYWQRTFVYVPRDHSEEEFIRAKKALARKWVFKDGVLTAVSFLYLAFCWLVIVSFAANVDTKIGMEDLLFSIACSLLVCFVVSPLMLASAYCMVVVLVRRWQGGELLEEAVLQAREKLNKATEAGTDATHNEPGLDVQAAPLSVKDDAVSREVKDGCDMVDGKMAAPKSDAEVAGSVTRSASAAGVEQLSAAAVSPASQPAASPAEASTRPSTRIWL
eukprot:TRINITY_DN4876_c0_g2_i3.p1 TRINITY_DN4876_c0_g2~~TRINITY_DN4876_c0_g2_i3.p1  ORF type:complete len:427 (+),score=73.06 TRINITY_DN4876_c0_g2_i3:247-1527(+)